jgi:glycosyltransferase involved in cell wall biosynthesis
MFPRMVESLGLSSTVTYCGPVYGEQKKQLLASADLFVFPSFHPTESLPLVILEAMSYAVPVVATPDGGIPDMVEEGVTGFLVPKRNAQALADRLEQLIARPELRKAMGSRGRERFLQRFTLERFETDLRGIFEQALAAHLVPRADDSVARGHPS